MSTSSTSRPPACTSPTSSSCSACSTGSSTPASRSSSSSTTRRSWRTPTGSSTSAPAPGTTAAGSSSRAHPPTSSPPAPPSPASTWRSTSAPDRGPDNFGTLGLPDELVGEEGEAVTDFLGIDEAHGFLVAGLAKEALAGPEHDREDDQPQLVDQVVLD